MRTAKLILGLLLILTGATWVLQGVNILPGSFMTGDIRWAVIGAVALVVGIVLLVRRSSGSGDPPPA